MAEKSSLMMGLKFFINHMLHLVHNNYKNSIQYFTFVLWGFLFISWIYVFFQFLSWSFLDKWLFIIYLVTVMWWDRNKWSGSLATCIEIILKWNHAIQILYKLRAKCVLVFHKVWITYSHLLYLKKNFHLNISWVPAK